MNFKEEKPIYLQIEDYVCEQILSGKWPQGYPLGRSYEKRKYSWGGGVGVA